MVTFTCQRHKNVYTYPKKYQNISRWWPIAGKLSEREGPAIELPEQPQQQIQKQQQCPWDSLHIVIKDTGQLLAEGTATQWEPKWLTSTRDSLEIARKFDAAKPWARHCIYRVPQYLRDGERKAFDPQIVSLGPYHHGKEGLGQMERHKWRSLQHILKRTNRDIRFYHESMKKIEEKARSCYAGESSLSSDEFTRMLVLDGCFVLELLIGAEIGFKSLGYFPKDPVFSMRGSMHSIKRDMIVLENQLPLFVLDRLLGLLTNNPDQKGIVAKLVASFLDPLSPTVEPSTENDKGGWEFTESSDRRYGFHCLDVFRRDLLWSGPRPPPRNDTSKRRITESSDSRCGFHCLNVFRSRVTKNSRQQLIHCVTELRDAGITFKPSESHRFGDIDFKNGVLLMPKLFIDYSTKPLLLNLIAFEQCHLDCSNDITSYIIFMDNLINSPADVGHLHQCGIIEHWLGSDDEVAKMFNRLCQEVEFDIDNSYLSHLSGDINRYYGDLCSTWCATFKHKYFSNPWVFISLVAAVVLLLLTFAQTFYGVYGYYRPR